MKTIYGEVIYSKDQIYVIDKDNVRYLKFGLRSYGVQGAIDLRKPSNIILEYMRCFEEVAIEITKTSSKYLLLGLGVGTAANIINNHNKNSLIDVVEISKDVIDVSSKYFGFNTTDKIKIIEDDAFYWIKNTGKTYDVIFVDIFNRNGIPNELREEEFHNNLNKLLNVNSNLYINIRGTPERISQLINLFSKVYLGECRAIDLPLDIRGRKNTLFHFKKGGIGSNER